MCYLLVFYYMVLESLSNFLSLRFLIENPEGRLLNLKVLRNSLNGV